MTSIRSILSDYSQFWSLSNLDKWTGKKDEKPIHIKSILSDEIITRYSLKERILELERMRDQILYELDRLREITLDRRL